MGNDDALQGFHGSENFPGILVTGNKSQSEREREGEGEKIMRKVTLDMFSFKNLT